MKKEGMQSLREAELEADTTMSALQFASCCCGANELEYMVIFALVEKAAKLRDEIARVAQVIEGS